MCGGGGAEISQFEAPQLGGVEGADRMSEDAEDEELGEGELAPPDWRMRVGYRNRPMQEERGRPRSNARAVQRLVHTLLWCAEDAPITISQKKARINREDRQLRWTTTSYKLNRLCGCSNNLRRISSVHCGERRQASEHHEQCRMEERRGRTVDV